jgi:23S rRNA pseudouridine1911/1915/1917 synthase
MPGTGAFSILTTERDAGQRLDTIVALHLEDCSRSLAATLIRKGEVRVHGSLKKPGYKVRAGESIEGRVPPAEVVNLAPEPIPLDILFEDDHVIVLNKQPGLVVHPAPGHFSGTLVNGLLYRYPDLEGIGLERRPGIVHRLDKDTSGALVVAKNGFALNSLAQQFKARRVDKTYLALVYGRMGSEGGEIRLPVGRHPVDRKKMSVHSRRGRAAETRWHVQERLEGLTLVQIDLKTGRTHQIRVHLAAMHHPVVGDPVYCPQKSVRRYLTGVGLSNRLVLLVAGVKRQMLHAWRLAFDHPRTGERIGITAPMPDDMEALLMDLRQKTERPQPGA